LGKFLRYYTTQRKYKFDLIILPLIIIFATFTSDQNASLFKYFISYFTILTISLIVTYIMSRKN
jgi:hypothetical protein